MFCPHCGASNPDGAAFCQYCGNSLSTPSAPLPSMTPPPPVPTPGWGMGGPGAPPPPPPRRRSAGRTILIILVVLIVVILIAGVISYLLAPSPATVEIVGINFQSPDNACGLNGAVDPTYYNTTAGTSITLSYDLTGPNSTTGSGTVACAISSVTTTTAGFSISGADVPLSVPANTTQVFTFTVNPPNSAWTGTLTVVLT